MRKCVICLVLLLLGAWGTAESSQSPIMLAGPVGDPWNQFVYDTGGIVQVEIAIDLFPQGLNSIFFALDLPECDGLTLVDVAWNLAFLHLGSLETGVAVTFVGCKTGPLVIATLTFQSNGIDECCFLKFIPSPDSQTGEIEGWDCSNDFVAVRGRTAVIAPEGTGHACAAPPPPTNPSPADGAVNQPLSTMLSWDSQPPPLGCGLGICAMAVRFGTDPDNMPSYFYDVGPPLDVGALQPNTTYYWKVILGAGDWNVATTGPVWSFTTTDGVAAATSTWGRIKALYR